MLKIKLLISDVQKLKNPLRKYLSDLLSLKFRAIKKKNTVLSPGK